MRIVSALAALLVAGAALPAAAAALAPTSYSMRNGDGQATGGTYNYWDRNYNGLGSTLTDGAVLSGGLGDLTDGVTTTDLWFNVENNAGTGPYVGWRRLGGADPTVTFSFADGVTVNAIDIWLDNSTIGGVFAPAEIRFNGTAYAFTPPPVATAGRVSFTGLSLTGPVAVQFIHPDFDSWVFVSEVQFFGTAVPEPANWAMLIAGFGLIGAAQRRRRAAIA